MEHKIEVRQMFDESFKRMVIEEYLATKCSKMELLKKYNIPPVIVGKGCCWSPDQQLI